MATATWYTDGSMLLGRWAPLRCTGFGVVVVALSGALIGFGFGTPPNRITTAAAAELWAIDFVLGINPTPPKIKTDCMSIIAAARTGTKMVTDASRPLARLWRSIEDSLDGDIGVLVRDGHLNWIPAHLSLRAVGERRLPNGDRLSMVDWRANRLVDILAKMGSKQFAPTCDVQKLLSSVTALAKHWAAQLGQATHIANNFKQETEGTDGKMHMKVCRDSVSKPRCTNITPPIASPPPKKPQKPKAIRDNIKPWSPDAAPSKRARVMEQTRKRSANNAALELAALQWRAPPAACSAASAATSTNEGTSVFLRILERLREQPSADNDGQIKTKSVMTPAYGAACSAAQVDVVAEARRIMKRARQQDGPTTKFPRLRIANSSDSEAGNSTDTES